MIFIDFYDDLLKSFTSVYGQRFLIQSPAGAPVYKSDSGEWYYIDDEPEEFTKVLRLSLETKKNFLEKRYTRRVIYDDDKIY